MNKRPHSAFPYGLRSVAAIAGLTLCLLSGWWAVRDGMSRLLSLHGRATGLLDSATEAVRLSPTDAEAHYAQATALLEAGQSQAALPALEQAVRWRPRDYGLWLALARARDLTGDNTGALAAFRQAVQRAPHYAQPRWQLGNWLLRAGQVEEAFVELRSAAASDATLLPNAADLAWSAFNGDARAVERVIQPQNDGARMTLAVLAAKRGKTEEALQLFRAAQQVPDDERRRLLTALLSAHRFHEAFEVWAAGRGEAATITDGGFEQGWPPDESSFGWVRVRDAQTVRLSFDAQRPHSGRTSLRIDWNGNSDPSQSLLLQLVPVQPRRVYRLNFIARTHELVAGGAPEVLVMDVESQGRALAQTLALPLGTSDWRTYAMEFRTSDTTNAVRVIVRRQGCSAAGPCPAFGKLWVDDFALR
ncbi:MAG: tetratricopeptide repeat protein [Acidobacteria bacterium]|nr:tetratricopeptide repeat protein [Acidobacteriota bacterium]